jgi:alanine-synthesizing transaminase
MKFSVRSANPLGVANPLVRAMEQAKREGRVLHDLTRTDPTGWDERAELEIQVLSLLCREESRRYQPDSQGLLRARQALSKTYGGAAEEWILCASTSEAYCILFQLLADPGQRVAICRPSYPLLEDLARHGGISLVDVPLRWTGLRWCLDIGWLERRLRDPELVALVLIQPGNPTGWWLSPLEREKVLSLCRFHGKALIVDEVFAYDLCSDGFKSLHGEDSSLVFVLGGLSKSLGLPQLKLGWIHASGPSDELNSALDRLSRLNDGLLSASTPVQAALEDLLDIQEALHAPIRRRCLLNLAKLQELSLDGLEVLPAGGGWTRILKLAKSIEETVCMRLLEMGVLVQPGYLYDLPGDNLVVSLLSNPADFVAGLDALYTVI